MATGAPPLLQVGVRYRFWHPAGTCLIPGKGEFPELFAPRAFDRTIGTIVPLTFSGQTVGHVLVLAAEVAEDGSGVTFTYEITDLEPQDDSDLARFLVPRAIAGEETAPCGHPGRDGYCDTPGCWCRRQSP